MIMTLSGSQSAFLTSKSVSMSESQSICIPVMDGLVGYPLSYGRDEVKLRLKCRESFVDVLFECGMGYYCLVILSAFPKTIQHSRQLKGFNFFRVRGCCSPTSSLHLRKCMSSWFYKGPPFGAKRRGRMIASHSYGEVTQMNFEVVLK